MTLTLFAPAEPARAQTPPITRLPSTVEPRPAPIPARPTIVPRADFDFFVNTPRNAREIDASNAARFRVADIRLDGATVYTREQLLPLFKDLIGREASLAEIASAATAIEQKYRAEGFMLAQAFVPRQRVRDQIFEIKIVEGSISGVILEGAISPILREELSSLLAPVTLVKPTRQDVLMRALMLANDLPGVGATGVLRASVDEPGAADLILAVDVKDQAYTLSVNNRGSRFQGPWTSTGTATFNGLLGRAEQIAMAFTSTPDFSEQRSAGIRYTEPLGYPGLTGSLIASYADGRPGDSLRALSVETKSTQFGSRLGYSIIRLPEFSLAADGGFTATSDRISLLHQGFIADDLRILDWGMAVSGDGVEGGFGGGRLGFAKGLPILGATRGIDPLRSRPGASGDFAKVAIDGRYQQPIFDDQWAVVLTAQAQGAFTSLPASQQFTVGGGRIGRAYDPSALAGDHGWGIGFELRYDYVVDDNWLTSLQPFVFYDAGKVWPFDPPHDGQSLASTGAGVRTMFQSGITAGLSAAKPLTLSPSDANGGHPIRILFEMAASL